MIDKLTEQEWQTNEAIARRLNVVIEAVEALRRQIERHEAAEDGADPADDEADPVEGDTLDLDDIEARARRLMLATWEGDKPSYTDQWQMVRCDVPALVAAVRSLCAERDAAQAEIAALRVENERLSRDNASLAAGYAERLGDHQENATLKATVERYEEAIACLRSNPNEWAERALVVIGTILGTPGPITPEALEWGVRKVQELGLGGEGQTR